MNVYVLEEEDDYRVYALLFLFLYSPPIVFPKRPPLPSVFLLRRRRRRRRRKKKEERNVPLSIL
jgi:hypothetical protein